jgi:regulator of extracellular matrix RemA (YlzA/DUF370 family)
LNIGFDNRVAPWRVTAILAPKGAAIKRLRQEAGKEGRLLDVTQGRPTRSLVVTDANQVILSAVAPETLMPRLIEARDRDRARKEE